MQERVGHLLQREERREASSESQWLDVCSMMERRVG